MPLVGALRRAARGRRPPEPRREHAPRRRSRGSSEAGIATVAELAVADDSRSARPRIGAQTFERLRHQARLQVDQRDDRRARATSCSSPRTAAASRACPSPSQGDLFFDMEGDPFFEDGLEYLFGVTWIEDGEPRFRAFWGTTAPRRSARSRTSSTSSSSAAERYPDLHVYHYAPYEPTALKRLMGLHATREDEVDDLLRDEVLVDLYAVVRQGAADLAAELLDQEGRGLLHGRARDRGHRRRRLDHRVRGVPRRAATESLLEAIERYNEDDCRSTWLLREWLLERRAEAIATLRRRDPVARAARAVASRTRRRRRSSTRCATRCSPACPRSRTSATTTSSAAWLLAQLLDYHRREAKPAWWAYFERLEIDEEQLIELDTEALGGARPTPASRRGRCRRRRGRSIYTLQLPAAGAQDRPGRATSTRRPRRASTSSASTTATGIVEITRGDGAARRPAAARADPRQPY